MRRQRERAPSWVLYLDWDAWRANLWRRSDAWPKGWRLVRDLEAAEGLALAVQLEDAGHAVAVCDLPAEGVWLGEGDAWA